MTVTVTLVRRNLGDVMATDDSEENEVNGTNFDEEEEEKEEEEGKVIL